MTQLYLREQDKQRLLALLNQYLPHVKAWAYGSRVKGQAHEASDLDIALRAPDLRPINVSDLSRFQEALTNSNIPILIDVREWSKLPSSFHQEIQKNHIELS